MSNAFSVDHFGKDSNEVTKLITYELHKLLPELSDKNILFSDLKMWGHALPETAMNSNLISKLESMNLYPIGDCLYNKGRVDGAVLSGIDLYEKLKAKF
jgi:predicted NAD/FAD-dependent oxidoreductase